MKKGINIIRYIMKRKVNKIFLSNNVIKFSRKIAIMNEDY